METKKIYIVPTFELIAIEDSNVLLSGSPSIYDEEGNSAFSPGFIDSSDNLE